MKCATFPGNGKGQSDSLSIALYTDSEQIIVSNPGTRELFSVTSFPSPGMLN
jgi:hypothetical protein